MRSICLLNDYWQTEIETLHCQIIFILYNIYGQIYVPINHKWIKIFKSWVSRTFYARLHWNKTWCIIMAFKNRFVGHFSEFLFFGNIETGF